jgi:very-short-patch-repair endonuclease
MSAIEHQIISKLEAARRELLDLSLRNPLLNYRPLKSRGVEVIQEVPAEIFRLLVREGKALSFLPGDAKTLGTQPAEAEEDPAEALELAPAQTDNKLQTRETNARLQARLLDTYHAARLFMEEQGVSILYLSLGTLTWYESESSAEGRQAPLILVPVELERTTAREQFQLRYTGGEIESNLSLIARMKADFGIALPELPEAEELNVVAYFDEVWRQVVGRRGWLINSRAVALGFFSFGKFLMYNDLDAATWPQHARPQSHPVLQALLLEQGFQEPASHIPDEAHLDAYLSPVETRQVVDADSSQTLAILDVNQGRNLVIQGPPGTGKSQTITNLIAEALGKGRTVLFVAEKMAALEVVKRRLDKTGLGEACLELHSHKTNKKDLLLELQRTLDLGKPRLEGNESEMHLLTQVRNRLNDYAEAINTPLGESGLTLYDIYGQLIRQREKYGTVELPRLALPSLLTWSPEIFKGREALVEEVQARLKQIGLPRELLFWGSGRRHLLPTDQVRLLPALSQGIQATENLQRAAHQLATVAALPVPERRQHAEFLFQAIQVIRQSPDYRGLNLRDGRWEQQAQDLDTLLAAGKKMSDLHRQYEGVLIPEAWEQPLLPVRQDLLAYGDKWWRFLSGAYRRSKKLLAGFTRTGLPPENAAQLALVDAVLEGQRQKQLIRAWADLGQALFGTQWQGETSNWVKLAALRDWVRTLRRNLAAEKLPPGVLDYLAGEPDLAQLEGPWRALEQALSTHNQALAEITALLQWQEAARFGVAGSLANEPFAAQTTLFQQWLSRPDELHAVVAWNILADRLQDEGLHEIINLVLQWPAAGAYLAATFRQTWLEALLEKAYAERPALRLFDRASHEEAIHKFSHLDHLLLDYNRARLAALHWQQLPLHQAGGQLGVLRREFEKKARHLPIRQLMARAGTAIQAIKPVFMMGPLSIANFLPPAALSFDLVIFDEASQVKPVDALGAILRARQVVVVGDSKQMPPTSFFDALVKDEEAEEEENIAAEVESVLGLFAAQGAPQRMLRWHYRSRHESLVAVSNQEFYDNRLVIFPSPDAERRQTGLIYHHLPDTFYDRGKTRTNPREAEAVARAIMAHARNTPELTLGVAAFSMAQMQAIINQLEVMRRQDPSAEPFFAAHPHEPFFVKNLENVQGDERDVIFISIGYGRTEDGFLSMSFGPLNGIGGERRLNVLITRARRRCDVFTNLTADDIDLSRTQARGVQAFKTFLSYAQTGQLASRPPGNGAFHSPFEEAVYRVLTQAGYQVQSQVGSAGFFIDLAVVHPRQPGKYLLGIECDGANYHRARSARDRDRLRQSVLEGLGWHLYRIWSTDWFRNPEAEQKRLFRALEKALQEEDTPLPEKAKAPWPPAAALVRDKEAGARPVPPPLPPYQLARIQVKTGGRELHQVPVQVLSEWVQEVIRVESPVHEEEVLRRIAEAAAVPRVGPRLKTAVEAALALAVRTGAVRQQKGMYWSADMRQPPLRDRSTLPAGARNMVFIAPEEVALAVEKVVGEAFGMPQEEVAPAVARLLGFPRLNEDIREQIEMVADQLLQAQKLQTRDGQVLIHPG